MASIPPSGNGHKPLSARTHLSLKERHQLSLTELAFGRNIGRATARVRKLESSLIRLGFKLDEASQALLDLLEPGVLGVLEQGVLGEMPSWTSWIQERIAARECIIPRSSLLRREDKDKNRPSLSGRSSRARAKEVAYDAHPDFLRFWSLWPKKVGKLEALREWVKLKPNPELVDQILASLRAHTQITWRNGERRYIKDPERWLKHRRWEDEVIRQEPLTLDEQLEARWAEEDNRATEPPLD